MILDEKEERSSNMCDSLGLLCWKRKKIEMIAVARSRYFLTDDVFRARRRMEESATASQAAYE